MLRLLEGERERDAPTHRLHPPDRPGAAALLLARPSAHRVERPRARDRPADRVVLCRVGRALALGGARLVLARRAPLGVPLDELRELRRATGVFDEAVLEELLGRRALRTAKDKYKSACEPLDEEDGPTRVSRDDAPRSGP